MRAAEARLDRERAIDGRTGAHEIVPLQIPGGQIDPRLEAPGLAGNHALEHVDPWIQAAGRDVHLAEVGGERRVVGPLAPQLLEQRDRAVHPAGDEVRRRILQAHREPAPHLEHLVGPRIGPGGLRAFADRERERRFIGAADAAVRRAEQLQQVAVARTLCERPLEHVDRARLVSALQIHARQARRRRRVPRIDLGRARELALGAGQLAAIEQPEAEPPVSRRVARREIDRSPDVAQRIVAAAEARLGLREPIPPLRVRRIDRRGRGVGVARRRREAVCLADHRKAAPSRAVTAIGSDGVERVARGPLHLGRDDGGVGKARQRRTAGSCADQRRNGREGDGRRNGEPSEVISGARLSAGFCGQWKRVAGDHEPPAIQISGQLSAISCRLTRSTSRTSRRSVPAGAR